MANKRWATVNEAAEHWGLSRQRIHQLIKKGTLGETKKVATPRGSIWYLEYPFRRNTSQRTEKDNQIKLDQLKSWSDTPTKED